MKLSNKYISDVKIENDELLIIYSNGNIEKIECNYENYKNALNEKSKSLENFDINGLIELISKVKKYKLACLGSAVIALLLSNFELLYFVVFMICFGVFHGFSNSLIETKDNYFEELNLQNMSQYRTETPLLTNQKNKTFSVGKDYEKAYLNTKELEEPKKEKSKVFIKTKK